MISPFVNNVKLVSGHVYKIHRDSIKVRHPPYESHSFWIPRELPSKRRREESPSNDNTTHILYNTSDRVLRKKAHVDYKRFF